MKSSFERKKLLFPMKTIQALTKPFKANSKKTFVLTWKKLPQETREKKFYLSRASQKTMTNTKFIQQHQSPHEINYFSEIVYRYTYSYEFETRKR